MQLFSQNLETLRVKNRRSKAEMAREFGVAFSSYKRWEEGTEPTLEVVVKIANYFDVSIDDLLIVDFKEGIPEKKKAVSSLPEEERSKLNQLIVDLNLRIQEYKVSMEGAFNTLMKVGAFLQSLPMTEETRLKTEQFKQEFEKGLAELDKEK